MMYIEDIITWWASENQNNNKRFFNWILLVVGN